MIRPSINKLSSFHGFLTNDIYIVYYLTCSLFFISSSKSEVFTVGDDSLWVEGFDYNSWANKYTFRVGDVLEFKYGVTRHNVYEVTQETYRSCDTSTGVLAKYDSGDDMIELKESRSYWFLCNIAGHCLGGMRFGIKTNGTEMSPLAPTPLRSMAHQAPPPPPPPLGSSAVNGRKGRISVLEAGILLLILNFIL